MGRLFLIDESKKENPTHFKYVDGERVVFKAHGLRSMGLIFLLAHEDAAGVSFFAAIEREQ